MSEITSTRSRTCLSMIAITLCLLALTPTARAQTAWNVPVGNWSVGTNWTGGEPTSGDVADINNSGSAQITAAGETCGGLILGAAAGQSGDVELSSGSLTSAGLQHIGYSGHGSFTQTGGDNAVDASGAAVVANQTGSSGVYDLQAGTFSLAKGHGYAASLVVGGHGDGMFFFGNAAGTGTITETGAGTTACWLRVRSNASASGTFQGWGTVSLTGGLQNNGRIVADGYGTDRTLDLSHFTSAWSDIENGTTNGWFAQYQGRLTLPSITVTSATDTYNWGEGTDDAEIDMVNSVRATYGDVPEFADLSISLLATDHGAVPAGLPGQAIGVWELDPGTPWNTMDLTFRYDNMKADSLGLDESDLRIFHHNSSDWTDVTSSIDLTNKRISADDVLHTAGHYAVAVPEPTTLALVSLGILGLLLGVGRCWPILKSNRNRTLDRQRRFRRNTSSKRERVGQVGRNPLARASSLYWF